MNALLTKAHKAMNAFTKLRLFSHARHVWDNSFETKWSGTVRVIAYHSGHVRVTPSYGEGSMLYLSADEATTLCELLGVASEKARAAGQVVKQ